MVDSAKVVTNFGTNRARRSLTSFAWPTPLPPRQTSLPVPKTGRPASPLTQMFISDVAKVCQRYRNLSAVPWRQRRSPNSFRKSLEALRRISGAAGAHGRARSIRRRR